MALVANSSQAVTEYTAQAKAACGVGARQMSTTPATSAAGTIPAWSQPRSLGLIGSTRSAARSTRAATVWAFLSRAVHLWFAGQTGFALLSTL